MNVYLVFVRTVRAIEDMGDALAPLKAILPPNAKLAFCWKDGAAYAFRAGTIDELLLPLWDEQRRGRLIQEWGIVKLGDDWAASQGGGLLHHALTRFDVPSSRR